MGEEEDEGCDYGVSDPCSEPYTRAEGLCTTECNDYLDACESEDWTCLICGCTNNTPCTNAIGETCTWVLPNLCSACFDPDAPHIESSQVVWQLEAWAKYYWFHEDEKEESTQHGCPGGLT